MSVRAGRAFVELFAVNNTKGGMDSASRYLERTSKTAASNSARLMNATFQNVKFSFTNPFGSLVNQATQAAEKASSAMGKVFGRLPYFGKMGGAIGATAGTALIGGAAVVGGASASVAPAGLLGAKGLQKFAEVEQELSKIQAVGNKTEDEMEGVRNAISDVAKSSKWSNQEVASGYLELTRAGFSTADANAAIRGVSNLAIATGSDMGTAGSYIGAILKAYGLEADKAEEISDKLVTAANNSAQGIEDLFESLKTTMPVAKQAGVAFDDLLAASMVLADKGVKGSIAATNISNGLVRASTDKKAMDLYRELGVDIYDENDNQRAIADIVQDVQSALNAQRYSTEEQTKAFKTLFGARNLSLAGLGDEALTAQKQNALANSQGAAQRIADSYMQGLAGTIERIKSTFDDFLVSVGARLAPTVQSWLDIIAEKLPSALEELLPSFERLGGSLPDLPTFIDKLIDAIKGVIDKSTNIAATIANLNWDSMLSSMLDLLVASGKAIASLFTALGNWIKSIISFDLAGNFVRVIDAITAAIKKIPGVSTLDERVERYNRDWFNGRMDSVLNGEVMTQEQITLLNGIRSYYNTPGVMKNKELLRTVDELFALNEYNKKAAENTAKTAEAMEEMRKNTQKASEALNDLGAETKRASDSARSNASQSEKTESETNKEDKKSAREQAAQERQKRQAEKEQQRQEERKKQSVNNLTSEIVDAYNQALERRNSIVESNAEKMELALSQYNAEMREFFTAYQEQQRADLEALNSPFVKDGLDKTRQSLNYARQQLSGSYALNDLIHGGDIWGYLTSDFPKIEPPQWTPPELDRVPAVESFDQFAQEYIQTSNEQTQYLNDISSTITDILDTIEKNEDEKIEVNALS